ncbi:hypothetical protein E5K00_01230 [Hymenobacter aquaticus]|uniref:DUF3322 and DUF2220 domain-containing protein n=1 Tax=Hymenobacter aquaticus TaxID=1867101 RepID=A0A4Z0Q1K5_9BACT|nr:Wadjet anti-phage system protein JetD domain-containing protein [Hymenobacter aquaticus]TGE23867.1 hypothetical protein E5K00_01230 [Hymenobacter aquaticus]
MITLPELRRKAARHYPALLEAYFTEQELFPLSVRVSKAVDRSQGPEHIYAQQAELLLHSKARTGRGYSLDLKLNRKTRQSEISRIYFETAPDLLDFTDKTAEYADFRRDVELIRTTVPQLAEYVARRPMLVVEQAECWPELLHVCAYFQQCPQPRQYVRNLPLALSTKFIERNQSVLRGLLDFLIPDFVREGEEDFFRRFHLEVEEPSVKMRFLDAALRLHPAVSQLSLWASEFRQLDLPVERVYIIENLTSFLSFPAVPGGLALWGGGFAVSLLSGADWLRDKQLFYWGDIDVHGFQILAQARAHYPALQSILMDEQAFRRFHQNETGGAFQSMDLPVLTFEENRLYQRLLHGNGRLEQEKLPAEYVAAAVAATAPADETQPGTLVAGTVS